MKTTEGRPSPLWLVAILAVPLLYSLVSLLLASGVAAGVRSVAPRLLEVGAWPSTFAKTAIALLALWSIFRCGLPRLAGLSKHDKWDRRLLVLIPAYLPLGMFYGMGFQVPSDPPVVFAAIVDCLLTGFSEEVFFRGFLLSLFVKLLWVKRGGIVFSVLLSSAIFGMVHLPNCIRTIEWGPGFHVGFDLTTQSTVNALVQVGYATFIGAFFAAVLLKTNRLWPLVLMHALVNFPGSLKTMAQRTSIGAGIAGTEAEQLGVEHLVIDLGGIVWTFPLLVVGLLLARTVKFADIAMKLDCRSRDPGKWPSRTASTCATSTPPSCP
jgi:membrane protease YdiL (CAAX protease family)